MYIYPDRGVDFFLESGVDVRCFRREKALKHRVDVFEKSVGALLAYILDFKFITRIDMGIGFIPGPLNANRPAISTLCRDSIQAIPMSPSCRRSDQH